jgi:transposase
MLIVSPQIKVYASLHPTDMRKSFDGLCGIVETQFGQQLEGGDLFLFFNRRRDRLKVLYFTGDGAVILYKRLERGTFEPLRGAATAQGQLTLRTEELALLLDGIELSSVRRRSWWRASEARFIEEKSASSS